MLLLPLVCATLAAVPDTAEGDSIKRELMDAEVGLRELNQNDIKPLSGMVQKAISAAPQDELRKLLPGMATGMRFGSLLEEGEKQPTIGDIAIEEANNNIMETMKHQKEHAHDLTGQIDQTWDNVESSMAQQPSDFSAFFQKVGFKPDPTWRPDRKSQMEIDTQNQAQQIENGLRGVAGSFAETDEKDEKKVDMRKMSLQEMGKHLQEFVASKRAELAKMGYPVGGRGPSSFLQTDPAGLQQVSEKLLAIENSLKRKLAQADKAAPSSLLEMLGQDYTQDEVVKKATAKIEALKKALRMVGNHAAHQSAQLQNLLQAPPSVEPVDDDGSSMIQTGAGNVEVDRALAAMKDMREVAKRAATTKGKVEQNLENLHNDKNFITGEMKRIQAELDAHPAAKKEAEEMQAFEKLSMPEQKAKLDEMMEAEAKRQAGRDADASSLLQTGEKKGTSWFDSRREDEFDTHEKHLNELNQELASRIGRLKKLHTELQADKAANEKREKSHPHSKIYGLLQEIVAGKHPKLEHGGEKKFDADLAKLDVDQEHLRSVAAEADAN